MFARATLVLARWSRSDSSTVTTTTHRSPHRRLQNVDECSGPAHRYAANSAAEGVLLQQPSSGRLRRFLRHSRLAGLHIPGFAFIHGAELQLAHGPGWAQVVGGTHDSACSNGSERRRRRLQWHLSSRRRRCGYSNIECKRWHGGIGGAASAAHETNAQRRTALYTTCPSVTALGAQPNGGAGGVSVYRASSFCTDPGNPALLWRSGSGVLDEPQRLSSPYGLAGRRGSYTSKTYPSETDPGANVPVVAEAAAPAAGIFFLIGMASTNISAGAQAQTAAVRIGN